MSEHKYQVGDVLTMAYGLNPDGSTPATYEHEELWSRIGKVFQRRTYQGFPTYEMIDIADRDYRWTAYEVHLHPLPPDPADPAEIESFLNGR